MFKLSILIPAYNEAKTIHLILNKVKAVNLIDGIQKEIIIVNDFSSDNSVEVIEKYIKENPELDIRLFSQEYNQGKGALNYSGAKVHLSRLSIFKVNPPSTASFDRFGQAHFAFSWTVLKYSSNAILTGPSPRPVARAGLSGRMNTFPASMDTMKRNATRSRNKGTQENI